MNQVRRSRLFPRAARSPPSAFVEANEQNPSPSDGRRRQGIQVCARGWWTVDRSEDTFIHQTMKKAKRLTKKERKALQTPSEPAKDAPHIHCVACGRHINPEEFSHSKANWLRCAHGTKYASCSGCATEGMARLSEHDRSGQPVKVANVWH